MEPLGAPISCWPSKVAEIEFLSRFNIQMLIRNSQG
jgi:hypothetical protein